LTIRLSFSTSSTETSHSQHGIGMSILLQFLPYTEHWWQWLPPKIARWYLAS